MLCVLNEGNRPYDEAFRLGYLASVRGFVRWMVGRMGYSRCPFILCFVMDLGMVFTVRRAA